MDADLPKDEAEKAALRQNGIPVFDWDQPNALEEQIFFDIPTEIATKLINIVVTERGLESVKSCLIVGTIPFEIANEKYTFLTWIEQLKRKSEQSLNKRGGTNELLLVNSCVIRCSSHGNP